MTTKPLKTNNFLIAFEFKTLVEIREIKKH